MATERTNFYLQWKGTSACIDFRCECGIDGHIDSDFVYFVRCPACGALYRMPDTFYPEKVAEAPESVTRTFEVDVADLLLVQEIANARKRKEE